MRQVAACLHGNKTAYLILCVRLLLRGWFKGLLSPFLSTRRCFANFYEERSPLEVSDRLQISQRYSERRAKRDHCSLVQWDVGSIPVFSRKSYEIPKYARNKHQVHFGWISGHSPTPDIAHTLFKILNGQQAVETSIYYTSVIGFLSRLANTSCITLI